jgi:hypothetical protein
MAKKIGAASEEDTLLRTPGVMGCILLLLVAVYMRAIFTIFGKKKLCSRKLD